MPATCCESRRLKDGLNDPRTTDPVVLPFGVVSATLTVPVAVSSGACTLSCRGLTNQREASLLLILTVVPPRVLGKSPFHVAVTPLAVRLLPKIDTQDPGSIVVDKL